MSKRTIVKGTLILTITGLITKCLGFYNRIFLTRLIGVRELGIYQLIFPIYVLTISCSCHGIATAITKHTSFYLGRKKPACAKQVLLYGCMISLFLSILFCFFIHRECAWIAIHMLKNSDCADLLRILSPVIPFVAFKACVNAYFMGCEKPLYPGCCQLFEQIVRILSAYILSISYMQDQINAKLAVYAVVIGELAATAFATLAYTLTKKKQTTRKDPLSIIAKKMRKDWYPMTLNETLFHAFSSLEAIILPSYLFLYLCDKNQTMELYGILTGIVIPFLLFPATITGALSTMLLPSISYARACRNYKAIKKALTSSAFFCILLGMLSWIGYACLGIPACTFAFHNAEAGYLLRQMAFLCPILYLSTTLTSVMNGLNLAFKNLIYSIVAILIRICCICFLVPIYGIPAYIFGMLMAYLLQCSLSLHAITKHIKESAYFVQS